MENLSFLGLDLTRLLSPEKLAVLIRVLFLVGVGLPLLGILTRTVRSYVTKSYTAQRGMIAGKLVFYGGFAILAVSVMNELGFSLAPLLGAAGIVGIAVGFASQTSVSNIISGLFLITEQPFVVGDTIIVGNTQGTVLSIDMLSIKLRTSDNQYVRIPNESIIRSQVINVTRFPIRRLDLHLTVAYKENMSEVRRLLIEIAARNPDALQNPPPMVIVSGFGSSSVDLLFAIWVERSEFLKVKDNIQEEIKARFEQEGIEVIRGQ
ncbi:MAG TPA: mechanosensitive ion channel family protein [Acidobacteriota bacterium]|nr:mechanosensitive ion channel family protein [Acidobacteriota bacterium]